MIDHIAIIGLGAIGRRHFRLCRELWPNLEITLVRSGSGGNFEEEKLANNIFHSIEEALDAGIEAAVIATPTVCHVEQAVKLMYAGVHVLVEKPLSHSTENVDKLLKCQTEQKRHGLVGYCLRFDPAAIKFKEKLSDKKIGRILHVQVDCGSYLPDWRRGQDYRQSVSANKKLGGGVLLELSHELDYIRWFFGDLDNVTAKLVNSGTLDIDVEDSAEILFSTSKGFTISVHLDFNSRTNRRSCKVRSTEGDLIWDAISKKVVWIPVGAPEEMESFHHGRNHVYREQLKHFLDCIENDRTPSVTFEDGAATLRIVEAARISSATDKKMVLA